MTITLAARRLAATVAILGVALAWLPSAAQAAPTFTFTTKALPIPGFPGTGDILGAGAMIEVQGKLSGTEYGGGFPLPTTGIRYFAPAGAKLHTQGFAMCTRAVLEQFGPVRCPKSSSAGPGGWALGVVSFGGERVPERASVQAFFGPGGSLQAFVDGSTPVALEFVVAGQVVPAAPPFSMEFIDEVPLIETVPGAPDASFIEGALVVGAAHRSGGKTVSYVTIPDKCPKGGWPVKVELTFLGGATAQASYMMPCPKR